MSARDSILPHILAELRRRKVWQVAASYVVVAVGVWQAADVLLPRLQLPDWTVTFVIALTILGFPIAIALAWSYDITWGGIERTPAYDASPTPHLPHRSAESGNEPRADLSAETSEPSIVVLPFDNLSPDPDDAYFSDGLTEEIITSLSYLRGLRVISRNSAMVLKGTGKDTRAIGRDLNVRYVLEGSVRKAGDALRITAQLIDARIDAHLWVKTYDGTLEDVFGMQESVARSLVEELDVELSPDERQQLTKHPIADSSAYQAYLRARQLIWQLTPEALDRARREMQNGLEISGPNPLFYAGLANVHWALYDSGVQHDPQVLEQAEAYADRALELDPTLPHAWLGRGLIRYKRCDMAGWLQDARRAGELGANTDVSGMLAFTLGEVGLIAEATEHAESALRLDPLSFFTHLSRAVVELLGGHSRLALERIRDAHARMAPGVAFAGWWHAQMAGHASEDSEARAVAEEAAGMDGIFADFCRLLVRTLARDHDGVLEILHETGLREMGRTDEYYPIFIANNLSWVGEPTEALDWIESAIGWGFTNHVFLSRHDHFLKPLRNHPRFLALMERAREKQRELAR